MKIKLKDSGFKQTPQRIAILHFLENNKKHPSVDDIYKAVSAQFPMISLATVYKNLEILKQMGMLRELTIDPDKKHFDPDITPHHHLICLKCKKIHDVDIDVEIILPENRKCGFEITGSHIQFHGICPDCQKNNSD